MKKVLIPIFLAFILLSGSVGTAEAASLTQSQISAIIGLLRSFGADEGTITNVNSALVGTTEPSGDRAWCHTFNTNLGIGDGGEEVRALWIAINADESGYAPANTNEEQGEPFFTEMVASKVTGFQEKYRSEILTPLGLKYGTGYVGKSTRAKLNQLYSCGVPTPTPKPVSAGYLEIEPSSASMAVGGSVSMQAMYQPPMPKCPEGFACPQVMPARFPVVAEWTSSNPSVASIDIIGSCAAIGCPVPTNVIIKGISNGVAYINALFNAAYGSVDVMSATAKVTVGSGSLTPSITVLSPNGGEVWHPGETHRITWHSSNAANLVAIYIYDSNIFGSGSTNYITPNGVLSPNTGYFDWVIPSLDKLPGGNGSTNYKIRVDDSVNSSLNDASDAPFSIVAAKPLYTRLSIPTNTLSNGTLTLYRFSVLAPKGGGDVKISSLRVNTSKSGVVLSDLGLYAYSDSGFSMQAYASNPVGMQSGTISTEIVDMNITSGGVPIVIPDGATRYFELRGIVSVVASSAYLNVSVEGLAAQTLSGGGAVPVFPVLISPNGGEVYTLGKQADIRWSAPYVGFTAAAFVVDAKDSSKSWIIFDVSAGYKGENSVAWEAGTGIPGAGSYYLKLCQRLDGPKYVNCDSSDAPFSIVSSSVDKMTVVLDASTPYPGSVSQGKIQVPLLALKFSAPSSTGINVIQVTIADVMSSGPVFSSDLNNFSLWDGATKIGNTIGSVTPPSPGVTPAATFSSLQWYIPPGTSKVLTVRADISPNATIGAVHALGLYGLGYSEFVSNNWAEVGPITGGKFTIASQTTPSITVISPNGGEVWQLGTTKTVSWSAIGITSAQEFHVTIQKGTGNIGDYIAPYTARSLAIFLNPLISLLQAGGGDYKAVVRVHDALTHQMISSGDDSNAPFSIVAGDTTGLPKVDILANGSNGPITVKESEAIQLDWNAINVTDCSSGGSGYVSYWNWGAQSRPLSGRLTISNVKVGDNAKNEFLIKCVNNKTELVVTDTVFVSVLSATQPSITITYPNGGETLTKGQSYFIRWAQTGFASDGWIQLQLRDAANSSAMVKLITSSVPLGTYAGSFNWTVPTDIPNGKYLIWATAGSGLDSLGTRVLGSDFSDAAFSISSIAPGTASVSPGDNDQSSSFAALLFSLERQLEELERLLNSLLP